MTESSIGSFSRTLRDNYLNGTMAVTNPMFLTMELKGSRVIVSLQPFRYDNIQWTTVLVIHEKEILGEVFRATYITIGVTIAIVCIGVVSSIFSGYIITQPFVTLKKEFQKISVLDFENVSHLRSRVTELSHIYNVFNHMTSWLIEFKSFLPSNIIQYTVTEEEEEAEEEETSEVQQHQQNYTNTVQRSSSKTLSSFRRKATFSGKVIDSSTFSSSNSILVPKKAKLEVGVTTRYISVASIRVEDPQQFLMHTCKISLQIILDAVGKWRGTLSAIDPYNYTITWNANNNCKDIEQKACTAAYQIIRAINKADTSLQVYIGVATGNAQCGVCGTDKQKIFAAEGPCKHRAYELRDIAVFRKINLLVDSATVFTQIPFVYKPVDVVTYVNMNSSKINILQNHMEFMFTILHPKEQDGDDEWMYSMERKQENEKYNKLNDAVQLLHEQQQLDGEVNSCIVPAIHLLEDYLTECDPEDTDLVQLFIGKARSILKICQATSSTPDLKSYKEEHPI
jgi:hypothetical protein